MESMPKVEEQTWARFQQHYTEFSAIGLSVDLSRTQLNKDFLDQMQPRLQKAFTAMADLERGAIANSCRGGREPGEARHVSRHVGDVLRSRQKVAIREVLHALVPALVVTKIGQLLEQHTAVLPGNRRYISSRSSTTIRAVAGSAGLVQLGAVREIRFQLRSLGELAIAQLAWMNVLRDGGSRQGENDKCGNRDE